MTYWVYIAVVTPIMTDAWQLEPDLQAITIISSDVLRAATTIALKIVLYLLPLELYSKGVAAGVSMHLWATGQMHCSY